jgi:hypothetical protein
MPLKRILCCVFDESSTVAESPSVTSTTVPLIVSARTANTVHQSKPAANTSRIPVLNVVW